MGDGSRGWQITFGKQDEALHYRTQFEAMRLQAGRHRV